MGKTKEQHPGSNKKILTSYQKAHKRAEHERQRLGKEHQKEEEIKLKLGEKEKQRIEKQEKKEAEEHEKELKRSKRKDEQKKKDEEKELEKKKKDDERKKKEDEKVQKEQEKKKEEEYRTKREEKQRAVLLGFLVKSECKKEVCNVSTNVTCGPFIQFELRKDMRMAPMHRMDDFVLKTKQANLDILRNTWMNNCETDAQSSSLGLRKFGRANYLHELRTKQIQPLTNPSTWPIEPPNVQYMGESSCLPITSSSLKRHGSRGHGGTVWLRVKLFQFVENYRPAYYGTWRRRSCIVTGRRPFVRDDFQLDYSMDSDDEWEEEEPGESITQSDNEEEDEEKDDNDEDDEEEEDRFFVPHGYLSDDEGVAVDECEECSVPDEVKKLRQRLSVAEYEAAHRRGLQRIKPLLIGPIWLPQPMESIPPVASDLSLLEDNKENVEVVGMIESNKNLVEKMELKMMRTVLSSYRVHLWTNSLPISVQTNVITNTPLSSSSRRPKKTIPEEAIPYLIHLVHRSPLGKLKLAFEFRVFWHRHTSGKSPECIVYADYKRYNASLSQNSTGLRGSSYGPILSGPAWDNLVLSQSLVLNKLQEIAIFEEGRWAVLPEVVQKFAPRLYELCGIQELHKCEQKMDKEFVSHLFIPPWEFLTDVATITLRSNRLSASSRRSLELSTVPMYSVSETVQLSSSRDMYCINDLTPVVILEPITKCTPHNPLSPKQTSFTMDFDRNTTTTHKNLHNNDTMDCNVIHNSVSILTENSINSGELTASPQNINNNANQLLGRKRLTLESFFSPPPPAKRLHNAKRNKNNVFIETGDCIIIDDSN